MKASHFQAGNQNGKAMAILYLLNKGIYREGNIIIDKAIYLIGIDSPILDGRNKHEILTITGKDIVIKGIHLLMPVILR